MSIKAPSFLLLVAPLAVLAACSRTPSRPTTEGALPPAPRPSSHAPERASPESTATAITDAGVDAEPLGATLAERARRCLEAPTCPASEAARLFVASDDAHEPESPCLRFLDGAGVARDAARARACLTRATSAGCGGASALLAEAELASMRIDGVGGPVDIDGARALVAQCFADVTRDAVLEHASAKERDPKTAAVGACDRGGTTLVWEQCAARRRDNQRSRGQIAGKSIAASQGADGARFLSAANDAYDAYVRARVLFVFEVYRGGSVRTALATAEEEALLARRAADLVGFASFRAKPASADDVRRAASAAAAALAAAGATTPEEERALAETDATWRRYRDAELALYDHAFGAAQGEESVRRALLVRLSERRAAECAAPSLAP